MSVDILNTLFSTNGFEAHSVHFIPDHLELMWVLIISNGAIALLYFLMPFEFLYIYFKRKDFPFRWVFMAVPLFGFWCSATHVVMLISFWYPMYYLQAFVDFVTGIVSFITFLAFVPATRNALKLLNPEILEAENDKLRKEVILFQNKKARLAEKNAELKKANSLAQQKNQELYELNKTMVDREIRILAIKEKINQLRKQKYAK